jgi:hypothetical protein
MKGVHGGNRSGSKWNAMLTGAPEPSKQEQALERRVVAPVQEETKVGVEGPVVIVFFTSSTSRAILVTVASARFLTGKVAS